MLLSRAHTRTRTTRGVGMWGQVIRIAASPPSDFSALRCHDWVRRRRKRRKRRRRSALVRVQVAKKEGVVLLILTQPLSLPLPLLPGYIKALSLLRLEHWFKPVLLLHSLLATSLCLHRAALIRHSINSYSR